MDIGGMTGGLGGVVISKVGGALFDHDNALGHIQTGYTIMDPTGLTTVTFKTDPRHTAALL